MGKYISKISILWIIVIVVIWLGYNTIQIMSQENTLSVFPLIIMVLCIIGHDLMFERKKKRKHEG